MKIWKCATVVLVLTLGAVAAENENPKTDPPTATTQAAPEASAGKAGPTITLDLGGGITLEAVLIPAGKFLMGRPPSEKEKRNDPILATKPAGGEFHPKLVGVMEYPQHEVTISKPFYIGKYEVTQEQFEKVMGYNPSSTIGPKNPVDGGGNERVTPQMKKRGEGLLAWSDTQIFCKKATELTGKTVRLPTEAEWEYAARAGGPPVVFTKAEYDEVAWWKGNSEARRAVGQKKPNAWGLYDMFGNISEFTQNWWAPYTPDAVVDPQGPDTPVDYYPLKVVRGAGWLGFDHVSTWKYGKPAKRFSRGDIGFRVVVEASTAP